MWSFKRRSVEAGARVYQVVDRSWRQRLKLFLAGSLACAALVNLGWQAGRISAVDALATNDQLREQLRSQQQTLELARERLGELTISGAANVGAREVALQDFQQLSRRIGELENELRYYRAVMPEADPGAPVRISSFETLEGRSGETRVAVLLTQNLRATRTVSGRIDMQFEGLLDGQSVKHELEDVLVSQKSPIAFDFQYFQALPLSIAFPAEFEPVSVVVRAHVGRNTVEREFAWENAEAPAVAVGGADVQISGL